MCDCKCGVNVIMWDVYGCGWDAVRMRILSLKFLQMRCGCGCKEHDPCPSLLLFTPAFLKTSSLLTINLLYSKHSLQKPHFHCFYSFLHSSINCPSIIIYKVRLTTQNILTPEFLFFIFSCLILEDWFQFIENIFVRAIVVLGCQVCNVTL